ncbi:MAG: cell division protein FtsL [Lachnospiraceae bacterium]|jgi:hypothetical protein|nr:cell division protein FtsL [Lachnospiraceae bacterium]
MAQNSNHYHQYNQSQIAPRQTSVRHSYQDYVNGNIAVEPLFHPGMEGPAKRVSNTTRKNRDKAKHLNLGYVAFIMLAISLMAGTFINYIQLRSDFINHSNTISDLESEVLHMKHTNEETYNHIVRSIDLEEVMRIAITELGMTYPQEGQVVTYADEGVDYFRSSN